MTVVTHSGELEESKTAEVSAEALDPLVGQTLDGRFRVVDVIGKGAMGKVYRAVQLPLNRAVALKVLDSRYGAGRDESFKQRFLVEAALTAKLSHPNTVRVVDYGSTNGLFFLAMEYLDGETLERLLTGGPLPWKRVLAIGQQMARALREAHELGVVHRDLKPANVVLLHADDDADFVKVLDFGLVKSFVDGHELEGRAITQQGMLMGSPPYMAPEQGEQNVADPRSDIYSLGTMLFEMLTGAPPFTGNGALEVILKHVHQPVPLLITPARFEPAPELLVALVQKCLAKSPMDRFQSMDELLLAMQDAAVAPPGSALNEVPTTDATVVAVPTVDAPPESVAVRARPGSLLVAAGFAVTLLLGVLVTWAIARPAKPSRMSLHIDSTPRGARVIASGKVLGVTPLDLEQGLVDGSATMNLQLLLDGYAPAEVTVKSGGRLELWQTLSALPPPPRPPEVIPVPKLVEPQKVPAAPSVKPDTKRRPKAAGKISNDDDEPAPKKERADSNELKRPMVQ